MFMQITLKPILCMQLFHCRPKDPLIIESAPLIQDSPDCQLLQSNSSVVDPGSPTCTPHPCYIASLSFVYVSVGYMFAFLLVCSIFWLFLVKLLFTLPLKLHLAHEIQVCLCCIGLIPGKYVPGKVFTSY